MNPNNVSTLSLKRPPPKHKSEGSKPTHDVILGGIRKAGKTVTVYLVSQSIMRGLITQFDKWTITIRDELGNLHTIYKHAIESFCVEDK